MAVFVRPGNPKKSNGWKDLDNKDFEVILATPKTSGGREAQARCFITGTYENSDVRARDAPAATAFHLWTEQLAKRSPRALVSIVHIRKATEGEAMLKNCHPGARS